MHLPRVFPKLVDALGFGLEDFQGLEHAADDRGGERGGEDEAAGLVAQVFDDLALAGDESAHRAERFREGAHDDVDLVVDSEMVDRAAAERAEDAEGVGLVDVGERAVFLRRLEDGRQVGDVAGHAEDAVEHDELAGVGGQALEAVAQRNGGVVAEGHELRRRELAAVDDAGVVLAVAEDGVALLGEGGERALVREKAGREQQHRLALEVIGKRFLELLVEADVAVEQAGAGAAGAELARRVAGGLDHALVLGEAEVVVRPDHDLGLAAADHVVADRFVDPAEIWVESLRAGVGGVPVVPALLC